MTSDITQEIEELLSALSDVTTRLNGAEAIVAAQVKNITDHHAPQIDSLTKQRDELTAKLAELFVKNEAALTEGEGKSAVFRSGTLSSRTTPGALQIEDESKAISWLKRRRLLRRFTRTGKRTINKGELKKYPEIVEKLPGACIDVAENLHIRLHRPEIEVKRNLLPFRVRTK